MEEVPIAGRDDAANLVKQFLANYDAPAYARRARQVEDAYEQLVDRCRSRRAEAIQSVRLRLGVLKALAGEWHALLEFLQCEQVCRLQGLHNELGPELKVPVERTAVPRVLRLALRELSESIDHFNRRWREFLESLDLGPINALRDGYNRYYLLEKECAMRSARLARQGFRRLEPVTVGHLVELFPAIPPLRHGG